MAMMFRQTILMGAIVVYGAVCSDALGGPFAPPAGEPNSTAIHMDDPNFIAWATGVTIERSFIDINDRTMGYAFYGEPNNALGKAVGSSYAVVSLGDGGVATVTFENPIANGPGYDFAVFENGFAQLENDDTFLELGFVEVSSDGNNFFRFNAISLTPTDTQVDSFGSIDANNVHNFAGKYIQGYGTPFELEELKDVDSLLDVSRVTHVRIIDVVGCIQVGYRSYDFRGHKVNDPWPTPFHTSGFDLDAVGVIHEKTLWADFSGDGIVDFSDYSVIASAYGSRPGSGSWNKRCDISEMPDDVINILDIATFAKGWLGTEQWYVP